MDKEAKSHFDKAFAFLISSIYPENSPDEEEKK